jgi:hypothetical protein
VSLETVSESELKNVLVSYETVVNPAYEAWSALSSRKRKAATEPPSTIEEPVYKDIRIEREQLNKIADVAFSYRLLAQGQQAVIFFDSQANQLQAKGTNQLAVNEGEFSVAEQQAQLPSDEDLLMQLMNDAAMQLGEKIKPEIEGLESRYLQTGEIAYAQSDFNQAAAQLAYWHVLAQSQSKPMNFREGPSLEDKMRFSIMRWK